MGLSIFEKVSIIFELFIHNPLVFLMLLFIVLIATTLIINLYIKKKYVKFLFPLFYLLFLVFLLIQYHTNITKAITLFIDDLFFQVYFPSIALYIFILLINLLCLFISLFNKKITRYSKIVNIVSFSLLQLLFAVFLFVITDQKLSLTDWSILYQNKEVLTVLEISMSVFLGWLLLLFIGYSMRSLNKKDNSVQDQVILSKAELDQLNQLVKKNVFKLSIEVEQLKEQLAIEKEHNKKQLLLIEQKIEVSNKFFIDKLKNITSKINGGELPNKLNELEKIIKDSQITLKQQLLEIQKEPMASKDYVDKKVTLLEKLMNDSNQELLKQIVNLQNTPTNEIDKINSRVKELEVFMKRYMVEMNYQLIQTRKEIINCQKKD